MKAILVDIRNFESMRNIIVAHMANAQVRGFDIETFDDPHEALADYRKEKRKVIFDVNRTTVAGFSLYAPGAENSWYVNLNHADVENRLPWSDAKELVDCATSPLIIHNKPFEQTMMQKSLGYKIGPAICTLQMAVSNHGPDEYDPGRLNEILQWEFPRLLMPVLKEFCSYDPEVSRELNSRQTELLLKVVGKETDSAWSYNGFVDTIAYHYDLKRLVRSFFGRRMTTYEELLEKYGAKDMRDLTGEQVCEYGGDDSYEAVQIFFELAKRIRPEAMQAFLDTELPMTDDYAEIWSEGININLDKVTAKATEEEDNQKACIEKMRGIVKASLPFPVEPNAELLKRQDWYAKGYEKQRQLVTDWANGKDVKYNATHYYKVRVVLYDLFGLKLQFDQGKVASDGDARGKLLENATGNAREMLMALKELASIDQRIKLYLTPYQALVDPDTGRVYPTISSKLATRRMAMSNPNGMQLAKHVVESQYIRGFYEAD